MDDYSCESEKNETVTSEIINKYLEVTDSKGLTNFHKKPFTEEDNLKNLRDNLLKMNNHTEKENYLFKEQK